VTLQVSLSHQPGLEVPERTADALEPCAAQDCSTPIPSGSQVQPKLRSAPASMEPRVHFPLSPQEPRLELPPASPKPPDWLLDWLSDQLPDWLVRAGCYFSTPHPSSKSEANRWLRRPAGQPPRMLPPTPRSPAACHPVSGSIRAKQFPQRHRRPAEQQRLALPHFPEAGQVVRACLRWAAQP